MDEQALVTSEIENVELYNSACLIELLSFVSDYSIEGIGC